MSERIPYGGDVKRRPPIREQSGLGSWSGRVTVTPLDDAGVVRFEIRADWTGPGLDFPGEPEPEGPVEASDVFHASSPELARALAVAAEEELRQDRVPNLAELFRQIAPKPGP